VRDPAWREDEPAGADGVLLVPYADDVPALEDVEELILVAVDVNRRVHQRRHFLEERERACAHLRRIRTRIVNAGERQALALASLEREDVPVPRSQADRVPDGLQLEEGGDLPRALRVGVRPHDPLDVLGR
jgi:hypothetical protein